jgi:hypothetical protein
METFACLRRNQQYWIARLTSTAYFPIESIKLLDSRPTSINPFCTRNAFSECLLD